MTVKDLEVFYASKKEHYSISDDFVKEYRQTSKNSRTYIYEAQKQGLFNNEDKTEPNQKWHLLTAYCAVKPDDFAINKGTFKCPELILWMAEAAGIEKPVLLEASEKAKCIINDDAIKYARTKAAIEMKNIIGWNNLEAKIMSGRE